MLTLRFRFALPGLVLALAAVPAWPQAMHFPLPLPPQAPAPMTEKSGPVTQPDAGATCKIYKLHDLVDFYDKLTEAEAAKLGQWIADMLPNAVARESWQSVPLCLPVKGVLIVHNTPAVIAQVDDFLRNLKSSLSERESALEAGRKKGKDDEAATITPFAGVCRIFGSLSKFAADIFEDRLAGTLPRFSAPKALPVISPFQGFRSNRAGFPGRCPGLYYFAPSVLGI